ncbi:MAG TPA: hypothetical protein DEP18_04110 [Flavobacteriales bacterium]|nr:hypothetical protein [Flavobacteriales bacterium]HCA82948.1 hypothetical protein [Flavobacteriales bacterium]HRE75641.1 hypothetical protein [Flavobacteriales bacterium]HRE97712.1 hypothetical protein [Flavobacteriales bacterium]HRJ37050.1 hypothetical protein [Flavobacteriales bacterium]
MDDPGFFYIAVSEIVFLSLIGFIAGWLIVMDAVPQPKNAVKWSVALFFAALLAVMASNTPVMIVSLFQIKPYFLLVFGIVFGFYLNRYNDRLAEEKRTVAKVLLTYIGSLSGLIFLNMLTYSAALLLIYLRSS